MSTELHSTQSGHRREWPLWEVFIRSQHGLAHRHVGSVHAADAEMAMLNARDVYTRRNEGLSIWVVPANTIIAKIFMVVIFSVKCLWCRTFISPDRCSVLCDFDRRYT